MTVARPSVLLVDDKPENLLALEAVLTPLQCRLVSVTSGEEALKRLLQEDFACALLDVQMPGMDGFEIAELVKRRERTRALPIIFVTAISKERHHVFRGYSTGAVDYVMKPYDPAVLRSKVAVFIELDAQTRAAARSAALARATFEHAPIGMARLALDGRIEEANRALCVLLGRRNAELQGRSLDSLLHGDDAARDADRRVALIDGALTTYEQELRLIDAGGQEIPCLASFSLAAAEGDVPAALLVQVQDLRERRRAEAEREQLIREQAARAQAEQVSQRLSAVQRITDAALNSLAFDELVGELLRRTADVLAADTAAIVLHEPSGEASVYQVAGGVDAGVHRRRWHVEPGALSSRVLEEGRPELAEEVADSTLHPLGEGVTSVLGVPLIVSGAAIGVMHVGTLFTRRFTADDVAVLGLAADRAALSIQRMQLFEREHEIAQQLQRSLLPAALPEVPGATTAARYLPGAAGADVGGDWYDVLVQPDGRLLLVIGDVAGRGVRAASTMGQLRSALRAYAYDGHDPGGILERLNAFHLSLERDDMATISLASADPATGRVCYANAGHPPPLMVCPTGRVRWLEDARGVPIGVLEQPRYETIDAELPPGSTIVLYTDGLVEERGVALDEGLARLADAVLSGPPGLDQLCDHVLSEVLADPAVDDDVTLLVLRTVPSGQERVELKVRGDRGALGAFRATTRRWVAAASSDETEVEEVTMAVNEAVQNAIEHGHRGRRVPVEVVLQRADSELVVTVTDTGRWKEGAQEERGRGFELMRAMTDDVAVTRGEDGTAVVLRRRLRAPTSADAVGANEPQPAA